MEYSDLIYWDIITPIADSFQPHSPNGFFFTADGRIDARKYLTPKHPWVHIKKAWNRECSFWHGVWFNRYNILPSPCLGCWKVVVRPRTVYELFQLKDLQDEMGLPSKCGIETRPKVHGNYGGYFYTDSHHEGLVLYKEIRDAVDCISPDIQVILKRGCTEFEMKFGKSSRWEKLMTPTQKKLEDLLNHFFVRDNDQQTQPKPLRAYIMRQWLQFAFERGDSTYLDITGGRMPHGVRPYETYHEEIE